MQRNDSLMAIAFAGALLLGAAAAVTRADYNATAGAGLTFGSNDISGVKYGKFVITDPVTPTFMATVSSGGALSVSAQGLSAGSTTSGQTGSLVMGAVTTAAPSYTTAQTNNLSLDVLGNLRVTTLGSASGGLSVFFVQPTASDNYARIKNGAGTVYKITVTNNSATVNYLRLYNTNSASTICNSATNLIYQVAIPANTAVGGISDAWPQGISFSTGIGICVTSGYATNDTTNATATAMSVNVGWL